MAGEENSWVGGGEDFLLSRPRVAMSSTKEGNAVIARREDGGRRGIGALGEPGKGGGDDGIVAFKRMGVVKCRSSFGAVDCLGERGDKSRQDNSASLSFDRSADRLFPSSSHQS